MDEFFSLWYAKAGALGIAVATLFLVVKLFYVELNRRQKISEEREAERLRKDAEEKAALTAEIKAVRDKHEKHLEQAAREMQAVVINNTIALQGCAASQHENAQSRDKLDKSIAELSETLKKLPCNTRFQTPRPPGV